MIVFFDRDIGTGVPKALRLVGFREQVRWLELQYQSVPGGGGVVGDDQWIELVGNRGWLAVSENVRILDNPDERNLIREHNAGLVFLRAAKLKNADVLAFMLRRMKWFEELDSKARPFAFVTGLRSGPTEVDLEA
ncbi:MAG: hypothetical protein OXG27_11740 [Chloroflexi bacterium]|nr:hypothetical protein [Chloroflexota bacterium]